MLIGMIPEPIGTDREGNEIKLYDIIETEEGDVPERLYLKENIQSCMRRWKMNSPIVKSCS